MIFEIAERNESYELRLAVASLYSVCFLAKRRETHQRISQRSFFQDFARLNKSMNSLPGRMKNYCSVRPGDCRYALLIFVVYKNRVGLETKRKHLLRKQTLFSELCRATVNKV